MKHLVDLINEGNIDRIERKYREFCGICTIHKVDPKEVVVYKTSKGNWMVRDKEDNKLFLVSNHILNDDVLDKKGIVKKNSEKLKHNYDEFCGMCLAHNVKPDEVTVRKHSDGPWSVFKDGKKVFTVSPYIFDDDLANDKEFKKCKKSIYEAKEFEYTVRFMQYDPDVLAEYEDGDVDDDELHNSLQNSDIKDITLKAKSWSDAESKITKELAKVVSKHSEVSACEVYDEDGEIIDIIYI